MMNWLGLGLDVCGMFTLALGAAHFFFPVLLDFKNAIPQTGAPLRPLRLGSIRYATTRADVHGIAWVMNHAASYALVSIGIFNLAWPWWWGALWAHGLCAWVAGWWLLRAGSQFYLGQRRGDWLIALGFVWLAVWHGLAALSIFY
jgi:hypothetical protein